MRIWRVNSAYTHSTLLGMRLTNVFLCIQYNESQVYCKKEEGMFFYKVDKHLLEKIAHMSHMTKVSLEETFNLTLQRGFEMMSHEREVSLPPPTNKSDRKKPRRQMVVDEYLKKNWESKTKEELAHDLGLKVSTIDVYSSKLSLRRWRKVDVDEIINSYWQTETDEKIAKRAGVGTLTIRRHRLALGLERSPRKKQHVGGLVDRIKEIGIDAIKSMLI